MKTARVGRRPCTRGDVLGFSVWYKESGETKFVAQDIPEIFKPRKRTSLRLARSTTSLTDCKRGPGETSERDQPRRETPAKVDGLVTAQSILHPAARRCNRHLTPYIRCEQGHEGGGSLLGARCHVPLAGASSRSNCVSICSELSPDVQTWKGMGWEMVVRTAGVQVRGQWQV